MLALLFLAAALLLRWLVLLTAAQECSDGTLGVESGSFDVCCVAACGTCGGSGCGNITGLTAQDCCVEEISLNGTFCVDSSTAPCILSTSESGWMDGLLSCDDYSTSEYKLDVCCHSIS